MQAPLSKLAALGARLRAIEPRILLSLFIVASCAWLFVAVAEEVAEGETRRIDETLLLALRTPGNTADPLGPPWVEGLARDVTALGSEGLLIGIVVAVAGALLLARKASLAVFLLLSTGSGALLSTLLKRAFDRPRPDLVPHGAWVGNASFPSGHALGSALVYLTLAVLVARLLPTWRLKIYVIAWAIAISMAIGASRVYLGVHWPSDVLAGWLAGTAWALGCWLVAGRLHLPRARDDANGRLN